MAIFIQYFCEIIPWIPGSTYFLSKQHTFFASFQKATTHHCVLHTLTCMYEYKSHRCHILAIYIRNTFKFIKFIKFWALPHWRRYIQQYIKVNKLKLKLSVQCTRLAKSDDITDWSKPGHNWDSGWKNGMISNYASKGSGAQLVYIFFRQRCITWRKYHNTA